MENKLFEIRDRGTLVPALGIRVSGADGYLMRRAGFGAPMVYLISLAKEQCNYDPYNWGNRTMGTAHEFIARTWAERTSGEVIDVEYIRGETTQPKVSEALIDAL
jgi:hypothetical protein